MMEPLGKRISNVSKAEPRSLLPSSTDVTRGSALGFGNQEPPVTILLETLAALIVEVYFHDKIDRNKR
jgi:hypothetical protein